MPSKRKALNSRSHFLTTESVKPSHWGESHQNTTLRRTLPSHFFGSPTNCSQEFPLANKINSKCAPGAPFLQSSSKNSQKQFEVHLEKLVSTAMALALDELETAASRFPISMEWATREHQGALERNGSLGTRGSKRNKTEQNGGNLERTQMEMLRKFQAWLEVEKFVAKAKGGVQSCSIQDMELDGRLTDVDSRISVDAKSRNQQR